MAKAKDVRGKAKWSMERSKGNRRLKMAKFKCGCNETYRRISGSWVRRSQAVCLDHTNDVDINRLGKKL